MHLEFTPLLKASHNHLKYASSNWTEPRWQEGIPWSFCHHLPFLPLHHGSVEHFAYILKGKIGDGDPFFTGCHGAMGERVCHGSFSLDDSFLNKFKTCALWWSCRSHGERLCSYWDEQNTTRSLQGWGEVNFLNSTPGKRTNVPWKSMVGVDVFRIEIVLF